MRTRMYGGVGGEDRRLSPLSRLLSKILEEADLIAPFSFFANAASTLQECTLTYHRPMPKKDNLPMGRQKCHPFALPENKPTRTKSAA
jgi:hypothetical protein